MATAVDAARAEVRTAMSVIEPQIAGLVNYLRLDLTPETRAKVQALLDDYNVRHALLDAVRVSSENLLAHEGYPNVPTSTVITDIFTNLQRELSEVQAAFGQFSAETEATVAKVKVGPETAQKASK